jgi:hypothetical protein
MGRRGQPRLQAILPVRISGTDRDGQPFSEHVCTMEISAKGTRLAGVRAPLLVGGTLAIGYHTRTAQFRVKWVALAGSAATETHVGVECLEPDKELWPIRLPVEGADPFPEFGSHRRRHARFWVPGKARVSKIGGGQGVWADVAVISVSGCRLHTSKSHNVGDRVALLIKAADTQIEANGVVRDSDSMSWIGIGFTHMSTADRRKLTRLIAHLEQNLELAH